MNKLAYFIIAIAFFHSSFICLNKNFEQNSNSKLLSDVFPIENIESVVINNINGKHQMTKSELESFRKNLKMAVYTGGLLEKPGHIFLTIKTKKKSVLGYIYASKNYIHFDKGIDKYNREFTGSYKLPEKFNFDSYK